MNISFEKGIYTIEKDNRVYALNLNNQTITNIKTAKAIKKIPWTRQEWTNWYNTRQNVLCDTMLECLHQVYTYDGITIYNQKEALKLLAKMEKFINLKYKYDIYDLYRLCKNLQTDTELKCAIYWTNILGKQCNEIDCEMVQKYIRAQPIMNEYPTMDKEFLLTIINTLTWTMNFMPREEDKKLFLYYYIHEEMYRICACGDLAEYINKYIEMCTFLNKEPLKTKNFTRELIETHKTYERLKNIYDINQFQKIANKLSLKASYSNNNFTIIIPNSPKDLIMEGAHMYNCVGSYVDKMSAEESYIVFVRKKDDINTSYITCEIAPNGQIIQYLLRHNKPISHKEDIQFKKEYQTFLNMKWHQ